jgi:hypothetical protein
MTCVCFVVTKVIVRVKRREKECISFVIKLNTFFDLKKLMDDSVPVPIFPFGDAPAWLSVNLITKIMSIRSLDYLCALENLLACLL